MKVIIEGDNALEVAMLFRGLAPARNTVGDKSQRETAEHETHCNLRFPATGDASCDCALSRSKLPGHELRIVFDGLPGRGACRFVEVENEKGQSINAGEWRQRPDGLHELVIKSLPVEVVKQPAPAPLHELVEPEVYKVGPELFVWYDEVGLVAGVAHTQEQASRDFAAYVKALNQPKQEVLPLPLALNMPISEPAKLPGKGGYFWPVGSICQTKGCNLKLGNLARKRQSGFCNNCMKLPLNS